MTLGKVPLYLGMVCTRALLLRHSPLKWTLASAYPPKPLLFDIGAPASVLASEPSDAITVPWRKVGGCLEGRRVHRVLSFSIRVSSQSPSFWDGRPSDAGWLDKWGPCPKNCRTLACSIWKLSYARADRETVEVSNYRAGTSKLSQYRSLKQSYTVLTHGLHVQALALRHSPLQAT